MTTYNQGPYPPPDPNQQYYGAHPPQPPGYMPPQGGGYPAPGLGGYPAPGGGYPAPGGGYPAPGGYPVPGGGYPAPGGGYPAPGGGYPPSGGYAPDNPGFQQQPYGQAGEDTPFSYRNDTYGTSFPEDGEVKGFDFTDKSIRRGFIRKVYSILMVQLSITGAMIAAFLYHEPTKRYVQHNVALIIVAVVLLLVSFIGLYCCGEVRRKFPINIVLLALFTLAEGFMLAVTASRYNSETVLMAVGLTAGICLALTLFAFQTKWDFTIMGGVLFVACIVLFILGIVAIFARSHILNMVYASIGVVLFSIYLIYDTQLMMGGKHKYSISPEEYIFAAINLYLDIINIFLYLLTIIGSSKD